MLKGCNENYCDVFCFINVIHDSYNRSYGVSGHRDEMKVEFANHEHTEAMTT